MFTLFTESTENSTPVAGQFILGLEADGAEFRYPLGAALAALFSDSSATSVAVPRLNQLTSTAADPAVSDYAAGEWGIHKNTGSGDLFLAYNDGGVMQNLSLAGGGGGGLTNWEENGTTLRPVVAGYDLGETGQRAGAIYGQTIDLSGIAQAGSFFSNTPQTVESQSQVGLYLTGAGSGVIRTQQANTPYLYVIQSTGKACRISHENIGWGPSTAPDARLYRIEANHLGMFNGVNPQSFSLYNTYADVSNFERGGMRWDTNALVIGTEAAGTGSSRDVHIKNLPTSNPGPGILWNNAGTPAIGT